MWVPAFSIAILVTALLCASPSGAIPAFPGAEGYGTETPGGRGGAVLFVTNTNDSGNGSLRAALTASGARIVVFRVGGMVTLNSTIRITTPFLTVAGHTAPGDGIQIRNNPDGIDGLRTGVSPDSFPSIEIDTNDVVIRHLRVRPGPLTPNPGCTSYDALPSPPSAPGLDTCVAAGDIGSIVVDRNASNVVLDHVSLSWASGLLFTVRGATDVTLQWSLLSEGINDWEYCELPGSNTPCPSHAGMGTITGNHFMAGQGEDTKRLSFHHNAFAHNSARNPQMMPYCLSAPSDPVECAGDVVNNVLYNWRFNGDGISLSNIIAHSYTNVVGNFTRKGGDQAQQAPGTHGIILNDWTSIAFVPNADLETYLSGNLRYDTQGSTAEQTMACAISSGAPPTATACTPYLAPTAFGTPAITTTTSAEVALGQVLDDAGANRRVEADGSFTDVRDANDQRVLDDIANGTGQIIDGFAEFPGWPTLSDGAAPTDSDGDGMPDLWEEAQCLDPGAADHNDHGDADGYTNLEEYLNEEDATPDTDSDGVHDPCDNCLTVANADQADRDEDEIGNACDPVTVVFTSVGAEDGFTLEQNHHAEAGGSFDETDAGNAAIRVGDNNARKQYRSVLSFDTAGLDDAATVVGAVVMLANGAGQGNTSGLGAAWVDVATGGFNNSVALEAADFQAAATAAQAGSLTTGGSSTSASLSVAGVAPVNKAGRTQIKLYFALGNTDDGQEDYLGYYSADNAVPANRPTLTVQYILP